MESNLKNNKSDSMMSNLKTYKHNSTKKEVCFICKENEIYDKGLCKSCLFSLFPSLAEGKSEIC